MDRFFPYESERVRAEYVNGHCAVINQNRLSAFSDFSSYN